MIHFWKMLQVINLFEYLINFAEHLKCHFPDSRMTVLTYMWYSAANWYPCFNLTIIDWAVVKILNDLFSRCCWLIPTPIWLNWIDFLNLSTSRHSHVHMHLVYTELSSCFSRPTHALSISVSTGILAIGQWQFVWLINGCRCLDFLQWSQYLTPDILVMHHSFHFLWPKK